MREAAVPSRSERSSGIIRLLQFFCFNCGQYSRFQEAPRQLVKRLLNVDCHFPPQADLQTRTGIVALLCAHCTRLAIGYLLSRLSQGQRWLSLCGPRVEYGTHEVSTVTLFCLQLSHASSPHALKLAETCFILILDDPASSIVHYLILR